MADKADTELGSSQTPSLDTNRPHRRTSCERRSILPGQSLTPRAAHPLTKVSNTQSKQAVHIHAVQLEIVEPAEQLLSQALEHDSDGRLSTGSSAELPVQDSARCVHTVGGYKGLAPLRVLVQSELPIAFRKAGASVAS
jgi:hypothetical protein